MKITYQLAAAAALSVICSLGLGLYRAKGAVSQELLIGCITAAYEPRDESWQRRGRIVSESLDYSSGYREGDGILAVRVVEYEGVEFEEDIPFWIGVCMEEEEGELWGVLELTEAVPSVRENGEPEAVWKDDFSMIVTFRAYGAETYDLSGKRIDHQEGEPPLAGMEEEILEQIGASLEDHQISRMEWAGECYEDDYGILYRNARISGSRRLTAYRAVYKGEVFRTDPIWNSGNGDETEGENPEETQEETAVGEKMEEESNEEEPGEEDAAQDGELETEPGPAAAITDEREKEIREPAPAAPLPQKSSGAVKFLGTLREKAEGAIQTFTESAEAAEAWFYSRTSILLPWETLCTGGIGAACFFSLALRKRLRRRRKYFL